MNRVPRVMAIHDLSGIGRSSLSAVISVLSTLGVQTCAMPTALLSTDTSQFSGFSFLSLTAEMHRFIAHWRTLNLKFDAVYSGFLGSAEQVAVVDTCLDVFADKGTLVVIDPVLGDNGELYATMTAEMVVGMRRLVSRADVITPNLTEAALLLDEPYRSGLDLVAARDWLRRLADLGPKTALITSAVLEGDAHGSYVLAYERPAKGTEFAPRGADIGEIHVTVHIIVDDIAAFFPADLIRHGTEPGNIRAPKQPHPILPGQPLPPQDFRF